MRFEHFAINVPSPARVADWYVAHCGMRIARRLEEAPFTHFLEDASGRVVWEIYHNDAAPVPDYRAQDPLVFHWALAVDDAVAERARLEAAGATLFQEVRPADGSLLLMMRDPFGLPLQLCQRAVPFK
ncbi:VOC family protein [Pelagicoccus sp. SDUM812003]|uniref:VOC family protein n=1 Tax=Pelagicoccus sp. SDUM812003 TaxID=3041267 RepID=UPI0028101E38|nr:VOC family protein [Pelagicoccus sp. SDUM812003]MDQ8203935.1 VOC family protein [Pelagicoccus sp. SDUM812003]